MSAKWLFKKMMLMDYEILAYCYYYYYHFFAFISSPHFPSEDVEVVDEPTICHYVQRFTKALPNFFNFVSKKVQHGFIKLCSFSSASSFPFLGRPRDFSWVPRPLRHFSGLQPFWMLATHLPWCYTSLLGKTQAAKATLLNYKPKFHQMGTTFCRKNCP